MSELLKNIDARTKLAGTNKLEILLFFLGIDPRTGRRETFGINVFKVREVMRTPIITAAPEMPAAVEGMKTACGAELIASQDMFTMEVLDKSRFRLKPITMPLIWLPHWAIPRPHLHTMLERKKKKGKKIVICVASSLTRSSSKP